MSPKFHEVSLDLFGPYEVKGMVKQRTKKKVWGVIITCLATRALHIDVTEDYGADSLIQLLRKFVSIRGSPKNIYSDKGSQLMCAAEELKSWALRQKIEWTTCPAEGNIRTESARL